MDLASVMDETDNAAIIEKIKNTKRSFWIGLYRKSWAYWSDQLSVNFTHWENGYPKNFNARCVAINTNNGRWVNEPCNNNLPFVCQGDGTTQTRLKVKVSSGADMNDPEVQRQLLQQVRRWTTVSLP